MKSFLEGISGLITAPFYALFVLFSVFLQESALGNWALKKLGLQGAGDGEPDKLVGLSGIVKSPFEHSEEQNELIGKVAVRGEIWAARLAEGSAVPQPGETVEVVGRKNLVLVVKKNVSDCA